MKVDEALRAWLVDRLSTVVGQRVHVGVVPETSDPPYVWVGLSGTENIATLDQAPGGQPFVTSWDVEIYGVTPTEVANAAHLLHAANCWRGAFATGHTVQGVFVTTQADDYVPRGVMEDEGLHGAFFSLEVWGFT